ncbi:hypothetical protein ANN_04933 [Periplaneta americana]|uniref:Fatty acyl-CoA reductase n=1 Tax=Periplaneta americana TaxID=6978 RepID=A0ABQ8TC58_PERAM|nr:hypothetical protein ANN_04933 [Periplaneta americana]
MAADTVITLLWYIHGLWRINMEECDGKSTPIREFYRGTNVFITGCTGFMGKVLVEKLLRSCPHIAKLFLMLRSKKGKDWQTRLDETFQDVIFDRLKKEVPDYQQKITIVSGDCQVEQLGLSSSDRRLIIEEVHIVFHVAATVKFDEKLNISFNTNAKATEDILDLAHEMKKLKVCFHTNNRICFTMCTCRRINMEECDGKSTPIREFYRGTNVFITGCTGFMGKVLVEKLLRSCPHIAKLFLMLRSKKGKDWQTRLDETFQDVIFDRLKKEVPDFEQKITIVSGDCQAEQLGLSSSDRRLIIEEVDIVFHVAATVRFDEKLNISFNTNAKATEDILDLAHEMKKLKVCFHRNNRV